MLYELIAARYERRSLLITGNKTLANGGYSSRIEQWRLAAIDGLGHHATILEMEHRELPWESYPPRGEGEDHADHLTPGGPSTSAISTEHALQDFSRRSRPTIIACAGSPGSAIRAFGVNAHLAKSAFRLRRG
ncbi:hypothetical protein [Bradyrhizobium sp. NBAIM01]|uniref:hypothetical protein n=1 Tax=Bradyrhizobium sp. NBAIM01 TaxID=2793818 RepID=UPI0023EE9F83|nr:hypothetical protein [Bradyrhizobium sp. NBAIM01]MCA1512718.1 ATP-binding protein [Bradyrhizobium sp. NBAIM01]